MAEVGDRSLITGRTRQGKTFSPPTLLKGGNVLRPPSVWLKLQAPVL